MCKEFFTLDKSLSKSAQDSSLATFGHKTKSQNNKKA